MSIIDFFHKNIRVKLVETPEELNNARRLRYQDLVLYHRKAEEISFEESYTDADTMCDNLIAIDTDTNEVVGTYRLITTEHLPKVGNFACECSFDVLDIKKQPYVSLELGRAVVKDGYRDGFVIKMLFGGIFRYVKLHNVRLMFGIISFLPMPKDDFANLMEYFYTNALDDPDLHLYAKQPSFNLHTEGGKIDLIAAKRDVPPVLKAYISMGCKFVPTGVVKDSFYHAAGVMIVLDYSKVNPKYIQLVTRL